MQSSSPSPRSLAPAIAIIALIGIFIFFALRVAFTPTIVRPTATYHIVTRTPLPTFTVTPSPTNTPTITNTRRPTWTLKPTRVPTRTLTPSITPTSTRSYPPTPIIATPYKYNDLYTLTTWSPEKADELIQILQGIPSARSPVVRQRNTSDFDEAFYYAAYAQQEALLRFPEAIQANAWRWGLAYNTSRLQDPRSAQLLADLLHTAPITTSIPTNLPGWFGQQQDDLLQERPFTLNIFSLATGSVLEITSEGGGVYLWQPEGSNQANPFTTQFNYAQRLQAHSFSGELTGDDIPELVVDYSVTSSTLVTAPEIYSLGSNVESLTMTLSAPIELATPYESHWAIISRTGKTPELRFNGTVFPACPVTVEQGYHWKDKNFFSQGEIIYRIQPNPEQLPWCERVMDHADLYWEPEATISLYKTLVPLWPPAQDWRNRPYPEDAGDEMRFRLAVSLALANDYEEAQNAFNELVTDPITAESSWIAPAQAFLDAYSEPGEVYRACQNAPHCNPRSALMALIKLNESHDPPQVLDFLQKHGVTTRSSGNFDFDGDGLDERWLTVRHHSQEKLEFWILADAPNGVQAFFVQDIDDGSPSPYYFEPITSPPIVQFERHKGFILHRLVDGEPGTPYLEHVETRFVPNTDTIKGLNTAIEALFGGKDPTTIVRDLGYLQDMPNFNCREQCDRFLYTLALALELSEQPGTAIDTYIQLWWEHLRSPFTIMAREKMIQLRLLRTETATPSKTPTITHTPTTTNTSDPNATATQTATATNTSDPNATETETPTTTITPTITETATLTATP